MSAASTTPRIFLSYSRRDAAYAAELRARIEADGLLLWQDITHMEGGNAGGWWDQIRERLEQHSTEHMVLLVSSDSLASGIVADEWRVARRHGVEVHLVTVPGKLGPREFGEMPAGMATQHFCDLTVTEQFNSLVAALKGPSRQLKVPMMAPAPDEHFVLRPEESDKLVAALLRKPEAAGSGTGDSRTGRAVGITAALRGAGGYGKTQLARWLCQQERIVDHFYDGILWVELGENPETTGSLQARVEELIRKLRREVTHEDTGFNSAFGAAKRLFELLDKGGTKDKGRFLLVIDDAWRKSDVDLFMGGAPGTVRLVTTRLDDTLPLGTDKIPVDAMKPAEAVELLTVGLDRLGVSSGQINEAIKAEIDANRPAPAHLAGRLGEWALLLTLANGQLRNEIEAGSPLPEALRYVEHIYDEMGLTAFDPKDEKQRSRVAALSIGASLRHLTPDEVARFEDLALFPEDEHIPVATIARLWAKTGSVDDLASQHLLRKLKKYALLMGLDLASATARLHDVMRKYLRDRVGVAGLIERHKAWLAAYDGSRGQSLVGAEQLYYYHRRPLHLAEAGEQAALDTLLTDVAWMQEKLAALGGPLPLIEDYRAYAPYDPANKAASALIGRALSLSAGALSRDVRQLVPHFLGRLLADMAPGMDEVLVQACRILRPPALIPRRPTLTPADSALLWTFEGHGGEVNSAAFSPDGRRIVSGSWDKTVRQWETATGATIGAPLAGHKEEVRAVAFSPDGTRIVSGSRDGTLRLWNAASGAAVGGPLAVPGPNKRLVAYNPATGRLIGKAPNYGGYWVTSVSFSPDGRRIVSGQFDGALRLWNAATGEAIGTPLKGHGAIINAVAISPDGQRIVSGSTDETLRLWDAASGAEIGKPLEGHGGRVNAVAFSPDGKRIVSGSDDSTLRLWDASSGAAVGGPFEGHGSAVRAVAFSPKGGRIVSGSEDGTLKLWDVKLGTAIGAPLKAHSDGVTSVAFSPDGRRIVSASKDGTLRLWDAGTEAAINVLLAGHEREVCAISLSPNGRRIAFVSHDGNLSVWDVARVVAIWAPFLSPCLVAYSPDGRRIVSGSMYGSLTLWDAATGEAIGSPLDGHGESITSVAFSPDGRRIVSAALNRTLILWDAASGAAVGGLLLDDEHIVTAVAFSPDGTRIVSGSSDTTLRLRDAASGAAVGAPLLGHGNEVTAVAFSPDGTRIVSGSSDRTLRLWDAASGAAVGAPLLGHGNEVTAVSFSPDGKRIVSGSSDNTLRLWDAESVGELARFEADAAIATIAVTRETLVAGDSIGRVHILDLIPNETAKAAWLARSNQAADESAPAAARGSGKANRLQPRSPPDDAARQPWWRRLLRRG